MISQQESTRESMDHRIIIVVTSIAALLILWKLDSVTQFTRAEIYFAEVAREMIATGDWITPRFCERVFFDKPPLTYWLIALCFRLFGFSEGVARIPSAMAGIATVALVVAFANRHFGRRIAALSGLILVTSPGFWAFARCAMSDALLTLFVSVSLFAFWEGLGPAAQRWKALVTAGYISLALATITKGPIGPVLVFLTLGTTLLMNRQMQWRRLLHPVSLFAFFAVALPWYIAAYMKHGRSFLDYFFVGENVSRFLGGKYLKDRLPIYYLGVLASLFFPWSIWVPSAIGKIFSKRKLFALPPPENHLDRFLLLWIISTVGFFSISRFKLDYYILPCYPALAILTAWGFAKLTEQSEDSRARIWLTIVTAALFVVLGLLFWKYTSTPILSLGAIMGACFLLWTIRQTYRYAVPFVLAGIVASILVLLASTGQSSSESSQTIHQFATLMKTINRNNNARAAAAFELAVWSADLRFYTGLPVEPLDKEPKVYEFLKSGRPLVLILPEEKLQTLESRISAKFEIVSEGPYLGHGLWSKNLRRKRPQTILLVQIH